MHGADILDDYVNRDPLHDEAYEIDAAEVSIWKVGFYSTERAL